MKDKMREEFEGAVKRDWPSAPLLRVNQVGAPSDGFYRDDRIQHAWWGWQASRAALVFELPVVDEREWAVTSDECAAMREGIEVMARRIESSGFKVNRPPKPVVPERACPGCGEKEFSANCMQCIPY